MPLSMTEEYHPDTVVIMTIRLTNHVTIITTKILEVICGSTGTAGICGDC
jgi:hypothetical protein